MKDDNKDHLWFPAMKYGVGWGLPVTCQGWAVFLTYMLLLIAGSGAIIKSCVQEGRWCIPG